MIDTANITANMRTNMSAGRENRISREVNNRQNGPHQTNNNQSGSFRTQMSNAIDTLQNRRSTNGDVDQRLMDTCVEMESLFVAKMLSEMRKTVHKSEWLHGGFAEDVFTDMLYDEYALQMSRNSNLGLARMIYQEMSQTRR